MKNLLLSGLALGCLSPSICTAADPAVTRHFWNFENESSRYADAVGGLDGTVTETTTVTTSPGHDAGGSAMNTLSLIANSNDFVTMDGNAPAFFEPGTGAFSMTLWFRLPADTASNRGIFDFSGNGFDGPQMLLTSANSLNFRVDGSGAYNLVAAIPGSTVEDDGWHFVAAVYDPALAADTLKIYLDGSMVTASASRGATAATTVVSPAVCALGTFNLAAAPESKGLDGNLDDLAYYSGALTEQQIGELFAGTLQPPALAAPADSITLTSYSRDAGTGESTLKWLTAAGTEYTVWGTSNLSDWLEVTVSAIPGTGGEVEFSHTPAGNPPVFFYQIRDN